MGVLVTNVESPFEWFRQVVFYLRRPEPKVVGVTPRWLLPEGWSWRLLLRLAVLWLLLLLIHGAGRVRAGSRLARLELGRGRVGAGSQQSQFVLFLPLGI